MTELCGQCLLLLSRTIPWKTVLLFPLLLENFASIARNFLHIQFFIQTFYEELYVAWCNLEHSLAMHNHLYKSLHLAMLLSSPDDKHMSSFLYQFEAM